MRVGPEGVYTFELFDAIKATGLDDLMTFPNANVVVLEVDGEHKLSTCHTSELFYYITEGSGTFNVGGELIPVTAGESVIVQRETEYGYWGKMKALLIMSPGYIDGCETRTDKSPQST